jgi:hypothetical protein
MDEAKSRAESKLKEVNLQIEHLVGDLLTADEKDIPKLTRQGQRLRVASLLLREIVMDLADPTTYRELTLLNKLLTGHDPEEEAAKEDAELEAAEVEARLAGVGVNPAAAGDLVRALNALRAVTEAHDRPAPAALTAGE